MNRREFLKGMLSAPLAGPALLGVAAASQGNIANTVGCQDLSFDEDEMFDGLGRQETFLPVRTDYQEYLRDCAAYGTGIYFVPHPA